MSYVKYIADLRKEFHHIKTNDEDCLGYEPAMVILNYNKRGKSFIIMLDAFYKYIEPSDNLDAWEADRKGFNELVGRVNTTLEITKGIPGPTRARAIDDMTSIILAEAISKSTKILPCVSYNLVKCLRMFEVTVNPQSASQLLMWIQDGIETLKNMPDFPPEKELTAGEVELWEGGRKVASKEMTVKESDLVIEEGQA